MAIGERIHFFRTMRGMTQKYLGMALGFPEKSADVRLAQYENGSRTPKADWKIVSGTDLPGIERRLSRGVLVERDRGDLLAAHRDGLSVSGGDDLRSGTRIARRCLVLCKMPHFS